MTDPYISKFGRMTIGEGENRWSIADPTDEGNLDAYRNIRGIVFPICFPREEPEDFVEVNRDELIRLLSLVDAYFHLGTYELGTKHVTQQLAKIRRILREAGRAY